MARLRAHASRSAWWSIRPRNSIRGFGREPIRKITGTCCNPDPGQRFAAVVECGEELLEPLVHPLIGREQDRAQDGWIAWSQRDGVGRDRMRAHHEPLSCCGQYPADPLRHGVGGNDEYICSASGQLDHLGLTVHGTAQLLCELGCFGLGQEMQGVPQQRPSRSTGAHERDVVHCHPAPGAGSGHFPAQQPGWGDALVRADDLDVCPSRAVEVAAQFGHIAGRAPTQAPATSTVTDRAHIPSPLPMGRWKVKRRKGEGAAASDGGITVSRPACAAAVCHHPAEWRCPEIRR